MLLESLAGWSWDPRDVQWSRSAAAVSIYAEREGNAHPPDGSKENGISLAAWVRKQRKAWSENRLTAEQIDILEAIPGWSWPPKPARWEACFEEVRAFAQKNGHARVPRTMKVEGINLGLWVITQRQYFKKGLLSKEQVRLLESSPVGDGV